MSINSLFDPSVFIPLISDPDIYVQQQINQQLLAKSDLDTLLFLEKIRKQLGFADTDLLDNLYDQIKKEWFKRRLLDFISLPTLDPKTELFIEVLLGFNTLVAKDLPIEPSLMALDDLKNNIWKSCRTSDSVVDRIHSLNKYFFFEARFTGNTDAYYLPENSDLNHVLLHRKGIPISLSILYYLIGNHVNIPIVCAAVPRHFMVFLDDPHYIFIDVFNQGNMMGTEDVSQFLENLHITEPLFTFLNPTPKQLIQRMFHNLRYIYQNQDSTPQSDWVEYLFNEYLTPSE